jgi:hypothetical protein
MSPTPLSTSSIKYRSKWVPVVIAWLGIVFPLCMLLGIIWIHQKDWLHGVWFLLASTTFVLLFGGFGLLATADIVVDDIGVSKMVFGLTLQKLRWIDIARMRISNVVDPKDGGAVKAYALVAKPGSVNFFSRIIVLRERKTGMEQLLSKFNDCVSRHEIKVCHVSTVN